MTTEPLSRLSAEARTGAHWWADKIRDGFALRDGAEHYAGSLAERSAGMTDILQRKLAERVTPDRVDRYEAELARRIQTEILDAYADPEQSMTTYFCALKLGVDYGPSQIHQEALEAAGLPNGMGMLPMKSTMWIEPGRVSVGDGYGAAPEDLELLA